MVCDTRKIISKGKYDVIVIGGGIAGVSAAVSSARNGTKTLLIEKSINLGGLATSGLISWYEPLCDGEGNKIFGGIAQELIELSAKYCFDTLPEMWGGDGHNKKRNDRFSTFYSPTVFTLALDEFTVANNVKIRFDTYAVFPVTDKNVCTGVICESADGREYFEAKVVIDATGNASICQRAGIPTVSGKNYMTYTAHIYDTDGIKKCAADGDTAAFRKWKNVGSDMLGNGHPKGMRMFCEAGAEDITDYVLAGKKAMLEYVKKKDKNSYDIMALPQMPQFRTIRRIVGESDFCAENGKICSDSIGECSDFRKGKNGMHYSIPYGALYNEKISNVLAAGRIISAPYGDGWEVSRVIPSCALTGEAAGNAAYLMVCGGCANKDIDLEKLKCLQQKNGIRL